MNSKLTYPVECPAGCQMHEARITGQEPWGAFQLYRGIITDCPQRSGWKVTTYYDGPKCIEAHEEE